MVKKIYIASFLMLILLFQSITLAKDSEIQYTRENISNYFLGIISANQDNNYEAFNYLKEVQSLKNTHSNFNVQFVRTLVLLEKFDQAINFSKKTWKEDARFFEIDLMLGLNSFIKEDYINAEKHFRRLIKITREDFFISTLVSKILLSWTEASKGNEENSFKIINEISEPYNHLTNIQNSFLMCYFNKDQTKNSFKKLINSEDYNFSRYNFFLSNYLLNKNNKSEAIKIIEDSRKKYNSNLLIKQTEFFFLNNEEKKIKKLFDCRNSRDSIAEFFYIIANLYSSEEDYKTSNFFLKISLMLNNKFLPNKALLAENLYYQKQYDEAKKIYSSIKNIGSIYSWYGSKSIAAILVIEKGKEKSTKYLKKQFDFIKDPNFENYYELANFYKDNEYYEESIKYYSLTLKKLEKNHFLVPKILDRRGTSYERLGDWEKAEKDLKLSLKIIPDQPHVLNYLAYSWIDKGINLDEGLMMLKKAVQLKENDGYIIDSLGWAYYARKDYKEAEKYLQKAVELLPSDPVINDHYGDVLWMMNKNIQARYIWEHVLKMKNVEQHLKNKINKKLIFGITKKL